LTYFDEYIAKTEIRNKLLVVGGSTVVPVVFCLTFTPEISNWLINKVVTTWNSLCDFINTAIPNTNITILARISHL